MKVGVPKESAPGENRVALVPDTAAKLIQQGIEVAVERGAGVSAFFADAAYEAAGAQPVQDALDADVVLKVQPPSQPEVGRIRRGAAYIGFLQPATNVDVIRGLAEREVTAFSLELLPRISRAQSRDALSSQANVGGYKAVLLVAPARVLVLGAGVAGLQAIATARRLGAVVEAYDVRAAAKEDVKSLGATFVELPLEEQSAEAGMYAREQTEETQRRQRELLAEHVASSDVVVTTAAIPGRRAPLLVTAEMVRRMRPGSVIVDLAADTGGNCELTQPGEEIVDNGVFIDGTRNLPSTVPLHASQLYSRNVSTLLLHMTKDGAFEPDFSDEIVSATCVTRGGEIVHEGTRVLLQTAAK